MQKNNNSETLHKNHYNVINFKVTILSYAYIFQSFSKKVNFQKTLEFGSNTWAIFKIIISLIKTFLSSCWKTIIGDVCGCLERSQNRDRFAFHACMLVSERNENNRHIQGALDRCSFVCPSVRSSSFLPRSDPEMHARIKGRTDHRNERDKGMPTVLSYSDKKNGRRSRGASDKPRSRSLEIHPWMHRACNGHVCNGINEAGLETLRPGA